MSTLLACLVFGLGFGVAWAALETVHKAIKRRRVVRRYQSEIAAYVALYRVGTGRAGQ
jgi:MFS superfamily sulfate permease-like transporter